MYITDGIPPHSAQSLRTQGRRELSKGWNEGMPDSLIDELQRWRDRAEEMLTMADEATDPVVKQTMLNIAAGYELLAQRAEERLAAALKRRDDRQNSD
jgi:hypothetical protein